MQEIRCAWPTENCGLSVGIAGNSIAASDSYRITLRVPSTLLVVSIYFNP